MKQSTINIRVIEPRDGYYLTKREREEGQAIILSKKVILSAKDSPVNWVEIPIEEGDKIAEAELQTNENGQMP